MPTYANPATARAAVAPKASCRGSLRRRAFRMTSSVSRLVAFALYASEPVSRRAALSSDSVGTVVPFRSAGTVGGGIGEGDGEAPECVTQVPFDGA